MSELTLKSCREFADILASKEPVPGGGGAAAYVGALGSALCTMVGNYTVGKKKYADVEDEVKALMAEAIDIQHKLVELAEADADAFEPLSKAYGIPKDDPTRDEVMENCLRNAVAAPAEMVRQSARAIELHDRMGQIGSKLMLSDVGTGVLLCKAALLGAALNVKVNTKIMKDREYAMNLNAEIDGLCEKYSALADDVYVKMAKRFNQEN